MNALKKITNRAKQLQRSHPNTKWTTLVKQAGREYRSGKKSKPKRRSTKKRTVRRRRIGDAAPFRVVPLVSGIGAVSSLAQLKSRTKNAILNQIAKKETAKARLQLNKGKKSSIRKIAKAVTKLKSDYRKFL